MQLWEPLIDTLALDFWRFLPKNSKQRWISLLASLLCSLHTVDFSVLPLRTTLADLEAASMATEPFTFMYTFSNSGGRESNPWHNVLLTDALFSVLYNYIPTGLPCNLENLEK